VSSSVFDYQISYGFLWVSCNHTQSDTIGNFVGGRWKIYHISVILVGGVFINSLMTH